MTGTIIPFTSPQAPSRYGYAVNEQPFDEARIVLETCVRALANSLLTSSSLQPSRQDPALAVVVRYVNDPALLASIARHPGHEKLFTYLLAFVLLERTRDDLWRRLNTELAS